VTDVLVRRGDSGVARRVAENRGARLSQKSFFQLVKRAENDDVLAEKVASRPDISPPIFHALLRQATAVVHDRLLASATPQMRVAIGDVLAKVSKEVGARVRPRDYRAAQKLVLGISSANRLNEATFSGFCRMSASELDDAYANYGRLSASTAQRVVRFWQVRQANEASSRESPSGVG